MSRWPSGVLIVLLLIFGTFASGKKGRLASQVSPGPLARPHAELEGTLKCTRCHGGGGRDAMPARCTNCHRDIAWLQGERRGYHGSQELRGLNCASCHPDHAGTDFALVKWPDGSSDKFDHRRTGWPLQQSHAKLGCDKCHADRFRTGPAARLSARKTPGGWTGLDVRCASCHEDVHRGALTQDCTKCHDAGKWTATPGFSHDTTRFPLTNRHTEVPCSECHLSARLSPKPDGQGHQVPVYRPVPHEACTDCHEDVHRGQFGGVCTKCHTTQGWKQMDRGSFDHSRTRYPLLGRHASVKCAACHQDFSTVALKTPAFQTCRACHKDAHNGTATLAGQSVDCAGCHTVAGFTPSSFTVEQHRNTKYILVGGHTGVQCASCHRKDLSAAGTPRWGTAKVIIRPTFGRCLDCHADEHGGQAANQPGGGDCGNCHRVAGWKPSTFDRAAHAQLKFALDGRHASIACRACHGADRPGLPTLPRVPLGKAGFLFKLADTGCADCHVDPHRGRFAAGGPRGKDHGCLTCHDTRSFRPSTTDLPAHAAWGFPLEGAHRATACISCHEEMKPGAAVAKRSSLIGGGATFAPLQFETWTECSECHKSPHGTQFDTRKDKGRCDACHGIDGFAPASRFNHDRDAMFPLKGSHEGVACNQCHPTDLGSDNPKSLVYRPLSGKCENCHGKAPK